MAFLTACVTRAGRRTALFRCIPFLLLASLVPATRSSAQPSADEYQVKAAYILNFARFVEWPSKVLAPSAPIFIAVVGDDPFPGGLDSLLKGKVANGHPIRLRHQHWDEALNQNDIVFISASEEPHLPQILRFLATQSVLTISDIDRFSLRGGIIELVMVGNRVRFDIDRRPAEAARLQISSRLLNVARAVHENGVSR